MNINIIIVGHVDHGKSTLIGRLLYDSENITGDRIAEMQKLLEEYKKRFEFAYFLDSFEEELMSVKRISKVEELFPALYEIGSHKNELPMELRGWVNVLDLYVQLKYMELLTSSIESLVAGGKYIGYFAATCDYSIDRGGAETMVASMFGDFSKWKIKKIDQKVWEKRFAHLVEPTAEIAWYLSIPDKENPMRTYGSKSDIEKYKTQLLPKLENAVKHFQPTGEWIGLHNHKCMSCDKDVSWWTYSHCEPCSHCSGKVRE